MITAVILAAGQGKRMGKEIPKQFLMVQDKPIIIYTLESFQTHPFIDAIEVVCCKNWIEQMQEYAQQYNIHKLKLIVPGGASSQESIRNGIFALEEYMKDEDMVIIHDGIRPLVDDDVLTNVIDVCKEFGNGVSSLPYNEQIFVTEDAKSSVKYIPRGTLRRVSTPQAYLFGLIDHAYRVAEASGIGFGDSSYANTMMADLGYRLYFAKGSDRNIKLTTQVDLEVFQAYLQMERKGQQ